MLELLLYLTSKPAAPAEVHTHDVAYVLTALLLL